MNRSSPASEKSGISLTGVQQQSDQPIRRPSATQQAPPPVPMYSNDQQVATEQQFTTEQSPAMQQQSVAQQQQTSSPIPVAYQQPIHPAMQQEKPNPYRLPPEPGPTYSPRTENARRYQDVSAEHLVENPDNDPEVAKWKSNFWKHTGQLQTTLGDITGIESWQSAGRTNEAWAETAYREAESRQRLGEASWINGEYNYIMGKLTNAIGYVAGDPEMQAKAQLRAREGQDEISKIRR